MAEYLAASGSRKISALTAVSELSGSTFIPVVMSGGTVQISHTNFLTSSLFNKSNTLYEELGFGHIKGLETVGDS